MSTNLTFSLYVSVTVAAHALLGVVSTPVSAAALSVSPLTISLSPEGNSQIVRVQNQGRETVLVHVMAVEWTARDPGGEGTRADEILAVPPIFRLLPDATQVVRLGLRTPLNAPEEKTYRLLVTEVADTILPINGVTFSAELNLPVFVTPKSAAPHPVWTIREASDGTAKLVLRNEGQAHLRVSRLSLQEPGATSPLLTVNQGVVALRGGEHSWRLEKPVHALPQMLEVRAETQRGELVVPLSYVRE